MGRAFARLGRLRRVVVFVEVCSATRLEFFNDSDICIYQHHEVRFYSVHPRGFVGFVQLAFKYAADARGAEVYGRCTSPDGRETAPRETVFALLLPDRAQRGRLDAMTHPAAAEAASESPAPSTTAHEPEHDASPQPDGFTLWAVWRRDPRRPLALDADATALAVSDLATAVDEVEASGVTVRGFYDVSALKADADLMVWLHGPVAEDIQAGLRRLRRTALLRDLLPTWNAMGVHRAAEFNKAHVPAFLRGLEPREWLTVYPFVRSYEWYLLPDAERSRMLADHGRKGAAFRSVLANTVAAFALGDYEWLLPMESDHLVDLVDMMRDLRATDARRHVREEVPFFTGRRIPVTDVPEVLQ